MPSGFAPLETAGGDPAAAEQLGDPAPGAEAKSFDLGPLHRRLAAAARSCYPKAASRFRVAGSAQVRFCLGAGGEVTAAVIDTSSGNGLLDAAATGCVVPGAAPFEVELAGQCFTLPVRFTP